MIKENLKAKSIFVTGSTGFVGTALIERILHELPDTNVVLLIRSGKRATSLARFQREILNNNCFDILKEKLGKDAFFADVARRIRIVSGDVGTDGLGLSSEDRAVLGSCDIAIHSAATVSFDAPLDSAVEVNLLGPSRVAAAFRDARRESGNPGGHFVSVSTCYVAGSRRGIAPEQSLVGNPLYPDVSWKSEVDSARRMRADIEIDSRRPGKLSEFREQASKEIGAAGIALLGDRTERIRVDWVKAQLVEMGKARAGSLGWPDAYAYTKALGEMALEENSKGIGVSVVRPSIIESALLLPYPGWIRGFRMAEPIIISFARGLLSDFPGVPEGTLDVIPVDIVVSAILAVAAKGPEEHTSYYQVASGSKNPLKYGQLVKLVRDYFGANPLYDDKGQPIQLPEWSNPGRTKVKNQLVRATKVLDFADSITSMLPLRGSRLTFASSLEEQREAAKRALSYVDLYGAYAECEAIYQVDRLLELKDTLSAEDLVAFDFDPRQVVWGEFVPNVHLPSIVEHSRVKTNPSSNAKVAEARKSRQLKDILAPEPRFVAFDLENTLIAANVVDSFTFLATKRLPTRQKYALAATILMEGPSLLRLDRADRSDFLRYFYRRYQGAAPARFEEDSWELLSGYLLAKAFPSGLARVRKHRELGHTTALITGALSFVVKPLEPLFDVIVSAEMPLDDRGRFTGEMPDAPPIGESRAALLTSLAKEHGYTSSQTVAYADSTSDLPMLDAAGIAVCVNPEAKLMSIARRRGWRIENWERAKGSPPLYLPIGGNR